MPKKKEKTAEEFWKGKCRELQKRVNQLEKQLGFHKKQKHRYEDIVQDYEEILTEVMEVESFNVSEASLKKCEACGKGHLEMFEILDRVYSTCNTCGDRKKVK
ncbi:MAG TPA: hypothetical protein PKI14_05090 [Fervidobacterium sp.]|nr:hypothetical protein [Fervidobacterium sp.]